MKTTLIKRRRRLKTFDEPYDFQTLAIYNAECYRGIVHTPEWDTKMKLEQERFDAAKKE